MAKMPTTPTTKSTKTAKSYTGPSVTTAKKVSSGMGTFLRGVATTLSVVAEVQAERAREVREIDSEITDLQLRRAALTGQRIVTNGPRWSMVNRGHLIQCPDSCTIRHCPTCGDKVWSSYDVYCSFSCR